MAPRNKGLGEPSDSNLYKKAPIRNKSNECFIDHSVKCYLTGGISPSRFQHFTRIYGKMRKNEKSAQGIKSLGTTKIG